jgi:glycosyltransferase involved in cell wall biosynthesis
MKVLLVHNHYQLPGGEDEVFAAEGALLEANGHQVFRYTVHNQAIGKAAALATAARTLWSRDSYREVSRLLQQYRPAVMHVHNTFPLLSPSVYYAARSCGVAIIQTLHNYRLLCPNALFFREGHVCEDCLGRRVPWPSVRHACYRGNRAASTTVTALLSAHRALGTWRRAVDRFIALTAFARAKFIEGGLPAERIAVKPNFATDQQPRVAPGSYALFVGRLSAEKGVATLLEAWRLCTGSGRLKVVGDGPLAAQVATTAAAAHGLEWVGAQPRDRVLELMRGAAFLIVPSVCYENFPLVIVEAYALGLPVIASDLGAMSSIVRHGTTGLHVRPGDAGDLARTMNWAWEHGQELAALGAGARMEFERHYTAERNHELLIEVYREAIARAATRRRRWARPVAATS